MKSSSLTRQRVPSGGMSLMTVMSSVALYSSLELNDEESVKAEAIAMKRRQMEATYHWTLTCFCVKDSGWILLKTTLLQLAVIAVCCSS